MSPSQWYKDNPCLRCKYHSINTGIKKGLECEREYNVSKVKEEYDCAAFDSWIEDRGNEVRREPEDG